MTCGHIWTCPVCSQKLRSKRAEKLAAGIRGLGGQWVMLTVTLRHRDGLSLKELLRGMMKAWRRVKQGGVVQRIWQERVTASARATEVTHGPNGWHPHLHVLLRVDREWDLEEKHELLLRWQRIIALELGQHAIPDDQYGLVWSAPFDAKDSAHASRYLAKLGLEVAGVAKLAARGHETPWQIAQRAVGGDSVALRLWHEFATSTKGRRAVELDDRLSDAARRQIEAERVDRDDENEGKSTRIDVERDDVRALRALERRGHPDIFSRLLALAEQGQVVEVHAWIAYARRRAELRSLANGPPPGKDPAYAS